MCIRDRRDTAPGLFGSKVARTIERPPEHRPAALYKGNFSTCLLYTSDAADERSSVDLGGRRIIKKKKTTQEAVRADVTEKTATAKEMQ